MVWSACPHGHWGEGTRWKRLFDQRVDPGHQREELSQGMQKIKKNKSDSTGISPLRKCGLIFSGSKDKADLLNEKFCSVFTDENPPSLPQLDPSPTQICLISMSMSMVSPNSFQTSVPVKLLVQTAFNAASSRTLLKKFPCPHSPF